MNFDNFWKLFRFDFSKDEDCYNAIKLSNEAKKLIENELINNFFIDSEKILIEMLKKTTEDDINTREDIYKYIKILERFKRYLNLYIEAGEEARMILDKLIYRK